jgi:iron complex outermembrane receptor protein
MRRIANEQAVHGANPRFNRIGARRHATLVAAVAAALTAMPVAYAADNDAATLEDVVVTAQKRTQNLQEVPLSIQAFTTEKLEELHIQSLDDYVKLSPSVTFQRSQGEGGSGQPGTAHVFIRGVTSGGDGNFAGPLPSVGMYLDEQPITTIDGALDVHIYDIERIEVLEGPQGTLYGASSEAGTIRIITNKPDPTKFSAGYDLSIDTVKHGQGLGHVEEGFINYPITKGAAVRLVGWQEHDAGFIDNVAGTNANAGIINGVRTFPSWNSPANGNTTPGSGTNPGALGNGAISNAAYVKKGYNTVDTKGGRAALKFDLDDSWTVTPTFMGQNSKANGFFGYDPVIGDLQVTHFGPENSVDSFSQSALTIEGKVHDFDITYAGAYMRRDSHTVAEYSDYSFFYDSVGGTYSQSFLVNNANQVIDPVQIIYGDNWFSKMSNEVRVTTPKRYPVKATMGAFAQTQVHEIYQRYMVPGFNGDGLNTIAAATNTVPYHSIPGWGQAYYLADLERVDRDKALFAQATWDMDPHWALTGGLRQFWFDNSIVGFFGFPNYVDGTHAPKTICPTPTYLPFHGAPCTDLAQATRKSGHTPLATLTYFGDDDLMLYGTYSKGFRPGGINRAVDPATGVVPPPYRAEYLTNFEFGWKTRWLNHHLRWNGAIFRENWNDFQFAHLGANSITVTSNAGKARINGLESDLEWSVGSGWTLSANGALLDAKLVQLGSDVPGYVMPIASGQGPSVPLAHNGARLPVTPRFKGTLIARYNFNINDWKSNVQGSLVHQGNSTPLLTEVEAAATGMQPAYSLFDLSAGAEHSGMSFGVFISNLFDSRAQLTRFTNCRSTMCAEPYIVPAQPRTIGIKFGQKF